MTGQPVDHERGSRAAIAARRRRAELKGQLQRGELAPLAVLALRHEPAVGRMLVSDFLCTLPGVGPVTAQRVMAGLGFKPTKRLQGVGVRQLESLARVVRMLTRTEPKILHVLAGPTAVGKGTVAQYIRTHYPQVMISVSATTRPPRPGEVEGIDYYFVPEDRFRQMIDRGDLLEWAKVHNSYLYGTPRGPIERALAEGKNVLLEIDLQGARQVKAAMPDAQLIFLSPPSWDELVRRLIGRGTESPEEQAKRLTTARVELAARDEFDAEVVNVDVEKAAKDVVHLMGIPTS